ncbi:unnamed protein product, partial [marine sediment metagenome]
MNIPSVPSASDEDAYEEAYVTQQKQDMEALADNFGNAAPQNVGRKRTRKPPATQVESESSAFRWLPASPPTSSVCNENLTATAEPVTKKARLSYVVNNAEDARERALMDDILNGEELPPQSSSVRSAYFNSSNESVPFSCDEEEEEEEEDIYRGGSPNMPSGWLGPGSNNSSGNGASNTGFQVNTDCCGDNPSLEYQEEVWCFGCQWVVRGP